MGGCEPGQVGNQAAINSYSLVLGPLIEGPFFFPYSFFGSCFLFLPQGFFRRNDFLERSRIPHFDIGFGVLHPKKRGRQVPAKSVKFPHKPSPYRHAKHIDFISCPVIPDSRIVRFR